MELIAHRGASHEAPENTLAAVQLAWQQGADAVEVDVHLSRDNRIVVIHDPNTRRTAGVKKKVRAQPLAELKALDVGRWKGPRWAGETIPTLEEVLATVPPGRRLVVELKCGPEIVPSLAEALERAAPGAGQVVPIGFDLPAMRLVKAAFPELEVFWLVAFRRFWRRNRWLPQTGKLIQLATRAGLDGLNVSANGPLTARFIGKLHAAGLKLWVWTVDSPRRAKKLAALGVDGLTTNRPGWLREQLL